MPVTAEQVEQLREGLRPGEWAIVQMLLTGPSMREVARAFRCGQTKVRNVTMKAESLIGQRIRAAHGRRPGSRYPGSGGRPPGIHTRMTIEPAPAGKPPGDRCPRCWLLEPHSCMALLARGEWMGDYETSLGERLMGGRAYGGRR